MISPVPGESATKAPREKTNSRQIAERSLISAMTYCLVVMASHFVIGENENFQDESKLTEGAKKTLAVVRKANEGMKMKVIPPHLIFNHDDSTQFVIRDQTPTSCGNKKTQLLLAHVTSEIDKGTRSLFLESVSTQNSKGGLRFKRTHLISAFGYKSIPFYSISLSDTELPVETCSSGYIIFRVEGMGPSTSTNPYNNGIGYVFMSRSFKGMDEVRYRYYRKHVVNDFIRTIRQLHDDIPKELTILPESAMPACLYFDGDISQLKVFVDPNVVASDRLDKISSIEHNAARTGTEQACDLAKTFPEANKKQKKLMILKKRTTPFDK